MGDEERVIQGGPLSREGWIMFLSNQITSLETDSDKNSNVFLVIISLFITVMVFITNTTISVGTANETFIPKPYKVDIFNHLSIAIILISILLLGFLIYTIYKIIKFYTITKKTIEGLKEVRTDIINEVLIDTNEIREKWRNLMQVRYIEIFTLDFLNLRFSISRKVERRR